MTGLEGERCALAECAYASAKPLRGGQGKRCGDVRPDPPAGKDRGAPAAKRSNGMGGVPPLHPPVAARGGVALGVLILRVRDGWPARGLRPEGRPLAATNRYRVDSPGAGTPARRVGRRCIVVGTSTLEGPYSLTR